MSKDNNELSAKLADQGAKITPSAIQNNIEKSFLAIKDKLVRLLGNESLARRLHMAVLNVVNRSDALQQCTSESIRRCLLQSAEMNLFPGPMQECAYLPFNNKDGSKEATFVPMYQGLIKLAYQGGSIKSVSSAVVYAGDIFEYAKGTDPYIKHIPSLAADRGERLCAYSAIQTVQGGWQIEILSMSFIEGIRKRSPAGKYDSGKSPWNNGNPDDYDMMAKKTALRQCLKYIPKSVELANALELDQDFDGSSSVVEVESAFVAPTDAPKIPLESTE